MEPIQPSPLISCICVTKNRPEFLLKAILSFAKQTYPNKELIISYPENDHKTKDIIEYIQESSIIKIERLDTDSIGKARNDAITKSNGKYICIWDDDDIYYPTRLTEQYSALFLDGNFESCMLSRILLYEATAQMAFLSYPSNWICSLLCVKEHLVNYPCADRDEFELAPILDFLTKENKVYYVANNPSLYIYVYHGGNKIQYSTFLFLVNQSETLPQEVSQDIRFFLEQQPNLTE